MWLYNASFWSTPTCCATSSSNSSTCERRERSSRASTPFNYSDAGGANGTLELDKRTSLGARDMILPRLDVEVFSPQTMAKYMCAQLSNEVLAIVPQLNDYLCPVCFSISYKPIRLRCRHVFCIRCMVVMQRSKQTHCPLCRGDVVMQADSGGHSLYHPDYWMLTMPR